MKMQLASHRGYWKTVAEQNTLLSFELAFKSGYGIEFDIRDSDEKLVVSHNMPSSSNILLLETVLELYNALNSQTVLALNIKSDGILSEIMAIISQYNISNYFIFDMSVPETIVASKKNISFFTRQSEYEISPVLYKESKGVWLDCFIEMWYNKDVINQHIENNKQVAIVSPELHKRSYIECWKFIKENNFHTNNNIILCTDLPDEVQSFFYE